MTSPIAGDREAPWRCIKPHCALNCDGCNHAIRNVPGPRMLVLELLDTFASDYEDGDSKLVDKARAFICEPEAALLEPVGEGNARDAARWRRLVNASEMPFPVATIADDPENDCNLIYGRTGLERLIDSCDEISDSYAASPKSNGGMGS